MTIEQKISVCREARAYFLLNTDSRAGMCRVIIGICNRRNIPCNIFGFKIRQLPELYQIQCTDWILEDYWFSPDYEGNEKRVLFLTGLINRLIYSRKQLSLTF